MPKGHHTKAETSLLAACPRLLLANHFGFSPGQREGPWAAASRLLIYVRAGCGTVIRGDKKRKLKQADYCLLNWGEPVRYVADRADPFSLITIHFIAHLEPDQPTPEFHHENTSSFVFQDEEPDVHVSELDSIPPISNITAVPHVQLVMERLVDASHRHDDSADLLKTAYVKVLLAELAELYAAVDTEGNARMADLHRVKEYIDWNFKEPLTAAWMAEMAGMSMAHFTRKFTNLTGVTPHQYLVSRRLTHAQSLLRMTTAGIKEIAAQTGFSDAFHLSHAFKKAYGISPSHYRSRIGHS